MVNGESCAKDELEELGGSLLELKKEGEDSSETKEER